MATLSHYLVHHQQVWDDVKFSSRHEVDVSEIWQERFQDGIRFSHKYRKLEKDDLTTWLSGNRRPSATSSTDSDRLALRLVWIPLLIQQRILDVAHDTYKQVRSCFDHELSEGYCRTISAGIGELRDHETSGNSQYFFSLHPKLFMTWSISQRLGEVNIICVAEEKKLPTIRDLLDQPFIQMIASQTTSPALICATLLSLEVERTQDDIKKHVRQVEVRTGHHNWKSRSERAALGDLTSLSAKMSGSSTRCGSCLRKQHTLTEVLVFVSSQLQSTMLRGPTTVGSTDPHSCVLDMVKMLQKRANAQKTDNSFIQRRVDTQLNAVSCRRGPQLHNETTRLTICCSFITSWRRMMHSLGSKWHLIVA